MIDHVVDFCGCGDVFRDAAFLGPDMRHPGTGNTKGIAVGRQIDRNACIAAIGHCLLVILSVDDC
jgi:hypothetical protein